MRNRNHRDSNGVSSVIGAILVTAIVFSLLLTVQLNFVPVWEKQAERAHRVTLERQLATLKSEFDHQAANRTAQTITVPLTIGRESTGIFHTGSSNRRVSFNTTGHGFEVNSNRMLILMSNGVSVAGLNPVWQNIPASGTLTNVQSVESLRIRITPMDDDFVGKNVNLTVTDANGALVGFFVVTATMSQNDYVISFASYQAPGTKLAEAANAQDKQTEYENYYVDTLAGGLLFDQVLAAAQGPFTIGLTKSAGVVAAYTISYTQAVPGGSVLVGNQGILREPYESTFNGGALVFEASSSHFPAQTYSLENGAIVLAQEEGAVFKVEPTFNVRRSGNIVSVGLSIPALSSDAASLTGVGNILVTATAAQVQNVRAQAPRLELNIETAYPDLWAGFFRQKLEEASLSSGTSPPQFTVCVRGGTLPACAGVGTADVELRVFGVTSDPLSSAYDMTVEISQAVISVKMEG